MSEWWTYRLSDFLLFSADIYYRLFEIYNQEIWPAHMLVILLGLGVCVLLFRPKRWSGRIIFFILAAGWLWVAWGYHIRHFSTINWVAPCYAAGFALQGVLLLVVGWIGKNLDFSITKDFQSRLGLALAGVGLFFYPFIAPLSGRPWSQAELWALTPDPTALVTLGLILLARKPLRWLLLPIPILWSLVSAATLWTMSF